MKVKSNKITPARRTGNVTHGRPGADPTKSPTPTAGDGLLDGLSAALKMCEDLEARMAVERQRLTAFETERMELETKLELTDAPALTRLAQLQAVAGVAPQRMEAQIAALEEARRALVTASNEFVQNQLRPRCLKLRQVAENRMREALKPHYQDAEDMTEAVNSSAMVTALQPIEPYSIITGFRTEDSQNKALDIIRAWLAADAFEQTHLN